ncbi:pyroglutamyl-peptidase I [Natronomonas gomsonensis]|uniref:pyroglutamyl-peptidase I n=1 Tax=Natronomonas gomsonensis TaxID=1046043 RepID=UPI0015BDAA7A|nr:pyroglutamyl-peptidase I [Natronomonas gomsonensis]
MNTLLLTGYEPFGSYETNPSARIAHALDGETVGEYTIVGRELPVVFDEALPMVINEIDAHAPDSILSTGLMPEREAISVERVGINVRDAGDVPDNAECSPVDTPVDRDGPTAYFATVPIRELVAASKDVGVPARVSNTAGTHLCNNILYATRHYIETNDLSIRSGFVHVPFTHDQVARRDEVSPSMSYGAMERSIRAMLNTLSSDSNVE